ncbi:MAG: TatD family hydrolase, partial [Syntrophorhabdales bacterium]
MSMFIDSHCHLEMEEFDKDREAVIDRAFAEGVSRMVTVATETRYFPKVVDMIEKDPRLYACIGIHPHNAKDYSDEIEDMIKGYLKHPRIVGYGEIGLDFYRDHSPRETQIAVFKRQIALAVDVGLPVVIHSRNAKKETLDILKGMKLQDHRTVIHCYSYDLDTAHKLLDKGVYLSIPGTVTYRNSNLPE